MARGPDSHHDFMRVTELRAVGPLRREAAYVGGNRSKGRGGEYLVRSGIGMPVADIDDGIFEAALVILTVSHRSVRCRIFGNSFATMDRSALARGIHSWEAELGRRPCDPPRYSGSAGTDNPRSAPSTDPLRLSHPRMDSRSYSGRLSAATHGRFGRPTGFFSSTRNRFHYEWHAVSITRVIPPPPSPG